MNSKDGRGNKDTWNTEHLLWKQLQLITHFMISPQCKAKNNAWVNSRTLDVFHLLIAFSFSSCSKDFGLFLTSCALSWLGDVMLIEMPDYLKFYVGSAVVLHLVISKS